MLKIYICPHCKTFRYVSKNNTMCFKCNTPMLLSDVTYSDFIMMNPDSRMQCIEHSVHNIC